LTGKQAADARALALLPTIRELMAAGFAFERGLVNELNRKLIPQAARRMAPFVSDSITEQAMWRGHTY
jgi:hypothetical protein